MIKAGDLRATERKSGLDCIIRYSTVSFESRRESDSGCVYHTTHGWVSNGHGVAYWSLLQVLWSNRALRIVMLSCQSHAMYGELFVNSSTGVRIQFV